MTRSLVNFDIWRQIELGVQVSIGYNTEAGLWWDTEAPDDADQIRQQVRDQLIADVEKRYAD